MKYHVSVVFETDVNENELVECFEDWIREVGRIKSILLSRSVTEIRWGA